MTFPAHLLTFPSAIPLFISSSRNIIHFFSDLFPCMTLVLLLIHHLSTIYILLLLFARVVFFLLANPSGVCNTNSMNFNSHA